MLFAILNIRHQRGLERKIDSVIIEINKNITEKRGELKKEIRVDIEELQTEYDELKTLVGALPAPSSQKVDIPLHDPRLGKTKQPSIQAASENSVCYRAENNGATS